MPFIKKERRSQIHLHGIKSLDEIQPGDRCYVYYKQMVDAWKTNPRWTTAHELYKQWYKNRADDDNECAHALAWQVFFQLHVMPYELKKREENGDI